MVPSFLVSFLVVVLHFDSPLQVVVVVLVLVVVFFEPSGLSVTSVVSVTVVSLPLGAGVATLQTMAPAPYWQLSLPGSRYLLVLTQRREEVPSALVTQLSQDLSEKYSCCGDIGGLVGG